MHYDYSADKDCALALDREDELAGYRKHFFLPQNCIYMDGNSLGLLSKEARRALEKVMKEWETKAISAWTQDEQPWFYSTERVGDLSSHLVGAKPGEVILTGSTTLNIHSLISSFYQPHEEKTRILADQLAFPSDLYALRSQILMKGYKPDEELVLVAPNTNSLIDENRIIDLMNERIALIFLPSVVYTTGQYLNMQYLIEAAHKRNILIGFDCCHSVGTIPHSFHEWDLDFAVWCSYKYLNGGPGSPAFIYVNERHFNQPVYLTGWWGGDKAKQFSMDLRFSPSSGIGKWQISTPNQLGTALVEGAIEMILQAGIKTIREKSMKITSYLIYLIDRVLSQEFYNYYIISPRDSRKRGGHLALGHKNEALRISMALKQRGIITDFRPPNIIRIAPIALYNSYYEVWQLVQALKEIIDTAAYKKFSFQTHTVT